MNNQVYCTECKNINFNLKCLEENYLVNGEECLKCPCHGCDCSSPEDSATIEERPKYQNINSKIEGLYNKYIITKADGTPVDPNADYFVLRLDTDSNARGALRNYANRIQGKNPLLSQELRDRCDKYLIELLEENN